MFYYRQSQIYLLLSIFLLYICLMVINDDIFKFHIWKQRFTRNRAFYSLV